jgi:hypothetical protein
MAAGDVTVEIVNTDATALDTSLTSLRVTANDRFFINTIGRDKNQILIVHIEESA